MNQFFYESRGKEKVKDLIEEGMRSQRLHQSGAPKYALLRHLPKLALMLLGTMIILSLLGH